MHEQVFYMDEKCWNGDVGGMLVMTSQLVYGVIFGYLDKATPMFSPLY